MGSVAKDNEFLQLQVIFPTIPATIPAPGVWEQTVSWNNVNSLGCSLLEQGSSV